LPSENPAGAPVDQPIEKQAKPPVSRTQLWVTLVAIVLGLGMTVPSYFKAVKLDGPSDAPTYLHHEKVLVNLAAYDFRAPYTDVSFSEVRDPEAGEVVLFRMSDGTLATKRVIAGPEDMVRVEGNRVFINGESLEYEELDPADHSWIPEENRMGSVIARETHGGSSRVITYSPGSGTDFGPERIPLAHYFLLGDNRDNSLDSRELGFVDRDNIKGKVVRRLSGR
jgi:signal peptidase I